MARGQDYAAALWVAGSSALVATFQPRQYNRDLARIAIIGPTGSRFDLYRGLVIGDVFRITTTNLGSRNTASFNPGAAQIPANESAIAVWTGGGVGATGAGNVTIFYDYEMPGDV